MLFGMVYEQRDHLVENRQIGILTSQTATFSGSDNMSKLAESR